MLNHFTEDPAGVGVAGLGDAAQFAAVTGSVFFGNQTKKGHQVTGVPEAMDVAQLANNDSCSIQLEAAHTHQGLNGRIHAPLGDLGSDQVIESANGGKALFDGEEILF